MLIKRRESNLLSYTLHNHTHLCKHAVGDVFVMVDQAFLEGFSHIGISDHVALPIKATTHRMEYEERIAYLNDLNQVIKDYQNKSQIKILRAFEAEYQEEYLYLYNDWFKNKEIDYLILGQHFEDVNDPSTYFGAKVNHQQIIKYVDICIEAMKSGLFLFIAHPDLFMNQLNDFDDVCYEQSVRLINASLQYNVYLEYNAGGIRYSSYYDLSQKEYFYPRYEFWQLVKQLNGKVVVNADAHAPEEINDEAYQEALKQVVDLNLNLVKEINFDFYHQRINENLV